MLKVENLTVSYGSVIALRNISLEVNEGEIVSMIGPNGAGKSTALKAICGLLNPTGGSIEAGSVIYKGYQINNIPPHELVRRGISLVPEGRRVFSSMSVLENLEMGGFTLKNIDPKRENIRRVYDIFPILRDREKQRAGTLSSGEQQMLAIGRALMLEPELLLLDEPSLGLSPNYIKTVFDRLKEINKSGITVIMVEQNAKMALEYSDRGYVFKIGGIFITDTGKNLLDNSVVRRSFLGEV